jgi:hypothetical protein
MPVRNCQNFVRFGDYFLTINRETGQERVCQFKGWRLSLMVLEFGNEDFDRVLTELNSLVSHQLNFGNQMAFRWSYRLQAHDTWGFTEHTADYGRRRSADFTAPAVPLLQSTSKCFVFFRSRPNRGLLVLKLLADPF